MTFYNHHKNSMKVALQFLVYDYFLFFYFIYTGSYMSDEVETYPDCTTD